MPTSSTSPHWSAMDGVAARQLLHHERVGERIGAGAAVGVGHGDPEQAELGHPGVDLGREALGLVELGAPGG